MSRHQSWAPAGSSLQGLAPVTAVTVSQSLLQLVESLVVFGAEAAWLCDPTLVQVFGFSPQLFISWDSLVQGVLRWFSSRLWLSGGGYLPLEMGQLIRRLVNVVWTVGCCVQIQDWCAAGPCRSQSSSIPLPCPSRTPLLTSSPLRQGCAQHTFPFPCKQWSTSIGQLCLCLKSNKLHDIINVWGATHVW